MTAEQLIDKIQDTVEGILATGDSSPKLYLRVQPNGEITVSRETSWCCSEAEYFHRVPHTLSLEILHSTRDYSDLSEDEIAECAENAGDAASQIIEAWTPKITEWIAAGNLL